MKRTPLYDKHLALGAKMTEFGGYLMPLQYSGVREEHLAVRKKAGIFDVSHMGEFIIKGKEALNLVQYVTSNDAGKLTPGQAQYSCLINYAGGIIDDLIVYRLLDDQCAEGEQAFMIVVNASNVESDWNWINQFTAFDTRIINISEKTGLLALQGPSASDFLQRITPVNLNEIPYFSFVKGKVGDCHNILISATGYTGSGGFELYGENEHVLHIWDALFKLYGPGDLVPAGLGARDTLRIEMGYCLYGQDIDNSTTPLEAGLGWITKLKKGPFVGREKIEEQKKKGIVKTLVGFVTEDRRVPRTGYPIESDSETKIGEVTSGTFAPSLERSIGMGYVFVEYAAPGTPVLIDTGRKKIKATINKMPFIQRSTNGH